MALRRRNPKDLNDVKKSRGGYTGAVTKAVDKLQRIPFGEPEEVQAISTKDLDRILASLVKTETGFLQTMEEALAFIPTDEEEEETFSSEEAFALEAFQDAISTARDTAEQLLSLKSILNGLADFKNLSRSIQDFLDSNPDSNQTHSLQKLDAAFNVMRTEWNRADLPNTHPLKVELDSCNRTLTTLEDAVAAVRDKSDTHSSITSTSSRSSEHTGCCGSKSDLPVIDVPKFHGDIMTWSTFWASFESTIGSRPDLEDTKKLHYLRMAIKDEEAKKLLYSPTETPNFYKEVVEELKRRYHRTREVHRSLTKSILSLQNPKQTRSDLRKLTDEVKRLIASFKATGFYNIESFLCSTVYLLLPQKLQTMWDQHTKRDKGVPAVGKLLEFLQDHAEALPSNNYSTPNKESENSARRPNKNPPYKGNKSHANSTATSAPGATPTPAAAYKWECSICKPERHPLHLCPKWITLTVPQRLSHVKNKSLCSNCLGGGHSLSTCKSTYKCRNCGQQHHTTLHQETTPPVNSTSTPSRQVPEALMTTARVLLIGPRGQEVQARALIDSGASLSLISSKMAQKLSLPLEPSRLTLTGVQGVCGTPIKHKTSLIISPTYNREKKIKCSPMVVKTVTANLPVERLEMVHGLPHLMGLRLADEHYYLPAAIDLLIGADLHPQIMCKQLIRTGMEGEPMAQATEFGWVISGPATSLQSANLAIPAIHAAVQPEDITFNSLFKRFLDAEETPDEAETVLSHQEQQAELHYSNHTMYLSDSPRYQVTLPKKLDLFPLGDSKKQAVNRFHSNENSLDRRKIRSVFNGVMNQYFEMGHAEVIPPGEAVPSCCYYLPMHAVFKDSSTTTKLRVVFDGSATTTSGISLNQALLVGPTIQPTLSEILLKFRAYPIALNADISKMYREVALSPADKDLHRFVWRESPTDPLQDCRMCRVTFGVSASPFLAVRTLQQTARDHGEGYPSATHHIAASFYVDDFLGGADTVQEATQLFLDLRTVLAKGGFNLTKWRSSSEEVLKCIPPTLLESTPVKEATSSVTPIHSKALGLIWDSVSDVMSPSIHVDSTFTPTKRGVYSDVSKTYDVLGWIAPTVVLMKILFQELWKTGQDWDAEIPSPLAEQHLLWRKELPLLKKKLIPRCYQLPHLTPILTELHAFCDASLKAYGAVVYCRTTYRDHPPVISLVTAKTKVARIAPSTVPRLELCGAVLLVKLLTSTAKTLNIPKEQWHAWTDSSIVLAWLDGLPRNFKTYVANRVTFILERTSPQHWKHVPTGENPADCSSRGMLPSELLHHTLWWDGPPWLKEDPYSDPHQPPRRALQPLDMELKQVCIIAVPNISFLSQVLRQKSNYYTCLTTAAWWLRLKDRLRLGRPDPDDRTKHLTWGEIIRARNCFLRESQWINFPKEMKALKAGQPIPPNSRLKSVSPLMDSADLLRVGGRLANSSLSLSQQHPIVADSRDPFIKKWFLHLHVTLCHCGPSLLLSFAGNHLHVLGARRLSRSVCSQCTICRRNAPRWTTQLMGDLPAARVNPVRAFLHTGMDFAGPFKLKMGYVRKPVILEAHICIFVCLTYKAVHLEVVSNQTTEAFQACLRRFISRRNAPAHLYSDNGPNFTGAKNELKRLYSWLKSESTDEAIQHYLLSTHGVTWHNSPPAAPHFGGLWESGVKSMKHHLKRVMGQNRFTFEELCTISCQVEACLNSRPLIPLTSHNGDGLMTLTASHFLLYSAPSSYPEDPRLPARPDLLKTWSQCQSIIQHFWQRWSREYLSTLQKRVKWQNSSPNLQVGDIVVMKLERTFSCHWPLAKITAVFPGQDSKVRVVEIKTATGILTRPVTKLALLHRPQEPQQPLPHGGCSDNMRLPAQQAE